MPFFTEKITLTKPTRNFRDGIFRAGIFSYAVVVSYYATRSFRSTTIERERERARDRELLHRFPFPVLWGGFLFLAGSGA